MENHITTFSHLTFSSLFFFRLQAKRFHIEEKRMSFIMKCKFMRFSPRMDNGDHSSTL